MRILRAFLLIFCALFQLVHPYSEMCPPFDCRNLGDLSFPYINNTMNDECGPFVVEHCGRSDPPTVVRFEKGKGKVYGVESIFQLNVSSITDLDFQKLLDEKSCESFHNLSFPTSPFAFFRMTSENLTLFKCPPSVNNPSYLLDFATYSGCLDFKIYYSPLGKNIPENLVGCTVIQLPMRMSTNNSYNDIFDLLTPTFHLQVVVLPECYHCHLQNNCGRMFPECLPPEKIAATTNINKAMALGLGLGLGAGIPATIMAFVLIWCLYKRKCQSSLVFSSATNSSDHSSKTILLNGSNSYFTVPIFSYDELEDATNNFDPQGELGNGGFGTVYYGRLRDGREVAVKRLYERNYNKVKQFVNEIEILMRLRHPNLVSLYGCTSRNSRELLLVYEYIPNGTVSDHLHGDRAAPGQPSWPIRMRIAIETASALSYLHASDIIHRDVKTNNILLNTSFCVKVADFGISRLFPFDVTHVSTAPQGTPGYVDPAYHQCYQLTDKSDVYSFGVVLIELISSLPAVDITRERHEINLATLAINKIQKCELEELIDPNLGYDTDEEIGRMITSVAELAFQCLQQDTEMRPSMNEVLKELIMIGGKENKVEERKKLYTGKRRAETL